MDIDSYYTKPIKDLTEDECKSLIKRYDNPTTSNDIKLINSINYRYDISDKRKHNHIPISTNEDKCEYLELRFQFSKKHENMTPIEIAKEFANTEHIAMHIVALNIIFRKGHTDIAIKYHPEDGFVYRTCKPLGHYIIFISNTYNFIDIIESEFRDDPFLIELCEHFGLHIDQKVKEIVILILLYIREYMIKYGSSDMIKIYSPVIKKFIIEYCNFTHSSPKSCEKISHIVGFLSDSPEQYIDHQRNRIYDYSGKRPVMNDIIHFYYKYNIVDEDTFWHSLHTNFDSVIRLKHSIGGCLQILSIINGMRHHFDVNPKKDARYYLYMKIKTLCFNSIAEKCKILFIVHEFNYICKLYLDHSKSECICCMEEFNSLEMFVECVTCKCRYHIHCKNLTNFHNTTQCAVCRTNGNVVDLRKTLNLF